MVESFDTHYGRAPALPPQAKGALGMLCGGGLFFCVSQNKDTASGWIAFAPSRGFAE